MRNTDKIILDKSGFFVIQQSNKYIPLKDLFLNQYGHKFLIEYGHNPINAFELAGIQSIFLSHWLQQPIVFEEQATLFSLFKALHYWNPYITYCCNTVLPELTEISNKVLKNNYITFTKYDFLYLLNNIKENLIITNEINLQVHKTDNHNILDNLATPIYLNPNHYIIKFDKEPLFHNLFKTTKEQKYLYSICDKLTEFTFLEILNCLLNNLSTKLEQKQPIMTKYIIEKNNYNLATLPAEKYHILDETL